MTGRLFELLLLCLVDDGLRQIIIPITLCPFHMVPYALH